MKIEKQIWIFLIVAFFGCKEADHEQQAIIEDEIKKLESVEDKKRYLENILEDDQKVRDGAKSADIMLKHGKDSKEFRDYVETQWEQDEINLLKVEKYMEIHGYPKKELGDEATTTPWMVIHHAQGYDARERNFEKVYEAYLKGDIDDGAISFYLGRMYEMKNRKRLKMESPYKSEDEINKLIQELNLENEKANVLQGMKPKS